MADNGGAEAPLCAARGSEGDEELESEHSSGAEEEKENQAEIQRLEEQLSINEFDYNCHLGLIKLLQQEGELVLLRRARQKMKELFPLTEELWLDWLKDEIRMASENSDREKIYELFERAVKDYICPEVWLEFAQYSIGDIDQDGGIEKVRAVFERALTAVGLHVTKGTAVWEAFREFENAILDTLQPPPGEVLSPEKHQAVSVQLEKIHTLFRRQLGIPLMDMETTFAEYEEWSAEPIPEAVVKNYRKALEQMEKYKPYEEALLTAEELNLAEYQAYIDFEIKVGDPARIQHIYERALAENCLVPDLWARYTQYLDRQLKVKDVVLSVHERAIRNCPWTVKLWKQYLLALERHHSEHAQVSETFEKALNAGFTQAMDYVEIWQAYLDYLRRRVDFTQDSSKELKELRSTFAQAVEYLKQEVEERFNESGDASCCIMQTWARIEARLCHNMQKARELWDNIMTKGNAKYANMWLEYYNLERAHGDTVHCRKALHRAVQCTIDYPEHVCEVLLMLERIEGTLEDWDVAVQKTESRLARVNEQRLKAAEKEAAGTEQQKQTRMKKRAAKKAKKPKKPKVGDKRKADAEGDWDQPTEAKQPTKRRKGGNDSGDAGGDLVVETEEQEEEEEEEEVEDMETDAGLFGRNSSAKAKPTDQKGGPSQWKDLPRVVHDSKKDSVTVFVSNLSYSLAEPGPTLQALFEACGEVAEVRPIFSNKGSFRGYGYVEFKEEKAALEALKMDRQDVNGRLMFVSPCVDKTKQPGVKIFKYSTTLEKHKLFIAGLPFSYTKEELEELCKAHGTVKEARLVTNRAGRSKGMAYVEFENEYQASQAVLKMDGLVINDYVIKVAISNPPARKQPEMVGRASQPPRQSYGPRGKGRTQLALLPRALQQQSNPPVKAENGTAQNPGAAPAEPKKMSNEDFARLLLNK